MSDAESEDPLVAIVLDFLPHGRADDDRPQYQKSPVAYAMGTDEFQLFELQVDPDASVGIDDRVAVDPPDDRVTRVRPVGYEDLSGGAQSELEYVVEDMVEEEAERFVDFYNDARAITTRLHSLNLLPGIGEKLRNGILDERKRKPFDGFEDLSERVS
ncbi:MAG: DUF655 domain-containing protein, partial [Halobacteriales archaeon]